MAQDQPPQVGVPSSSLLLEGIVRVSQLSFKFAEGNSLVNRVTKEIELLECPVKFQLPPFEKR